MSNKFLAKHLFIKLWALQDSTTFEIRGNNKQKSPSLKEEGIRQLIRGDCLIADVSLPSASVGYQVGYASSRNIPVLCLYSSEFGQKKPPQIIGVSDLSKLKIKEYSKKSVKKTVADFLNSIPKELIKFNFIITPEIQSYIDWGAKRNNISKSEFLREKVIQLISKDKEYKR